jgi:luciferase family oxidoreductase group 1
MPAAGGRAVRHAGFAVSGPHRPRPGPCAGTDQPTARALRRYFDSADQFPQDVRELLHYFEPVQPGQAVQAVPGGGLRVPTWILGSSLFGARMAASMGLPYAFASHFAPDAMDEALAVYRREFRPSATLKQPHAMLALNVVASDSEAESRRLFTSQQQSFVNLRRGRPGKIPAPIDDIEPSGSRTKSWAWSGHWPAPCSAIRSRWPRASPRSSNGTSPTS